MKRLAVLFVLPLVLGLSGVAEAGIAGSQHDLSAAGGEICIYCHFPHNADPLLPLWNRDGDTDVFVPYASPTFDAVMPVNLNPYSWACLTCHDGVTAFNNVLNDGGLPLNPGTMIGVAALGADLSDDHPVSFPYAASVAAGDDLVAEGAIVGARLFNGNVECASCHNVHDNTFDPFLRADNSGSAMCLGCHAK